MRSGSPEAHSSVGKGWGLVQNPNSGRKEWGTVLTVLLSLRGLKGIMLESHGTASGTQKALNKIIAKTTVNCITSISID